MISGATQADVAVLVVPASVGEFETAMGRNAQTREHAVLLKALGVNQILVVVNKMDMTNPPWCEARFLEVQSQVREMLYAQNFTERAVRFIPVSGLSGENLLEIPSNPLAAWWTASALKASSGDVSREGGSTLVQALDAFKTPVRNLAAPLRAVISSVLDESDKSADVVVRMCVLQGRLRLGRGVGLASGAGAATVRCISADDGSLVGMLDAGESATVTLVDRSGRSGQEMGLAAGMVVCKGPPLAAMHSKFRATVQTLEGNQPWVLIPGMPFELYIHGERVPCHVRQIFSHSLAQAGGALGEKSKKKGMCVGGSLAVLLIETTRPVCVETFVACRALGRFALRAKGVSFGVGVVDALA